MILKSALFRFICGLLISAAAAQSSAGHLDSVWVSGEVNFSCGTGTGGFEKYCSAGENIERGNFYLTYEISVPDSSSNVDGGFFQGAITSFEMSVSQINRPDLYFSLVGYGDISRHDEWIWWEMTLAEANSVVAPSRFSFGLVHFHQLANLANPNELPTSDFWLGDVIGLLGGGAGAHETDWLYPGSLHAGTIPGPVDIPVPGSFWLILVGLAGAALQRVRPRKRRFA